MVFRRLPAVAALSGALVLATQAPLTASAATPRTLVIGVDHLDVDNQQPQNGRLFEYTDFFTREVRVHKGDTLDFRYAPGTFHIVAVARDEAQARKTFPIALLDQDDPNAIGSGLKKIELGPSNGPITQGRPPGTAQDPPFCGVASPCAFTGGDDVESTGSGIATFDAHGNPQSADWSVTINAAPGAYSYLCFIHPGMQGHFVVVGGGDDVTTQEQVDARSAAQFSVDQREGLDAERDANKIRFSGGAPGTRTYDVAVGVGTANLHVAIDEMLPQHLTLTQGDKVNYRWRDPHNVHTVGFPNLGPTLPEPFGPEIEPPGEPFELVGDPGNAAPGSLLTDPSVVVDAGLRLGNAYHLEPTSQEWSVRTNTATSATTFAYQCTIHDFMVGTLSVSK
jgi:plastocyanin